MNILPDNWHIIEVNSFTICNAFLRDKIISLACSEVSGLNNIAHWDNFDMSSFKDTDVFLGSSQPKKVKYHLETVW